MDEKWLRWCFMQPFRCTRTGIQERTSVILQSVGSCIAEQRAIAVMYDLSGLKATGEDCSSIIEDGNSWLMRSR